jgi:plasmid stability protein
MGSLYRSNALRIFHGFDRFSEKSKRLDFSENRGTFLSSSSFSPSFFGVHFILLRAHDRSMEEEARIIIKNALQSTKAPDEVKKGLGSLIHQRFQSAGGVDLTLPARNQPARKPDIL